MKVLYITTTGSGDPTRASIPVHLAVNGSVEVGQEVTLVFAGDGSEVLGDTFAAIRGVGVPPMTELLAKAVDRGVKIFV